MRIVIPTIGIGLALSLLSPQQVSAEIVKPIGAIATSQFGFGIESGRLVDGSGLSGEGNVEGQLHDNSNANMWFSGCADGGIPGGTPAECPTGFEVPPVDEQIVDFVLDTTYDLNAAVIWQYNELSAIGPLPGRGVKSFEMLVSPSLTDEFTSVGTFNLAIGNAAADPEAAQTLEIEGADSVRRVRFRILDAHHGNAADYVGLSEVRFDGVAVGPKPIPTLSELGLLLLALTVLTMGAFVLRGRGWRLALAHSSRGS